MYVASIGLDFIPYSELILPAMFTINYEQGLRIDELEDFASISLNISPAISFTSFFAGKITGTANVNLFNYATYTNANKFGFFAGGGYEYFISTFNLAGFYPLVRAGIVYNNFRLHLTQSFTSGKILTHSITVGNTLDW
jgi:hypothetical protein